VIGRPPGSGVPPIRMAAVAASEALLAGTVDLEVTGPVESIGGFAIRTSDSLPVVLQGDPTLGTRARAQAITWQDDQLLTVRPSAYHGGVTLHPSYRSAPPCSTSRSPHRSATRR
jgi:hypothetical protein